MRRRTATPRPLLGWIALGLVTVVAGCVANVGALGSTRPQSPGAATLPGARGVAGACGGPDGHTRTDAATHAPVDRCHADARHTGSDVVAHTGTAIRPATEARPVRDEPVRAR